jgi:hypothetical protein
MKIRRERASAASAQACPPQCSARVDCDSPAVGGQRQRNSQLPGMYGPPPDCKEKFLDEVQSAQMYPASSWRLFSGP